MNIQQTTPVAAGAATAALKRVAFKMKLYPGKEAEYQKRHDELWPSLRVLLQEAGIREYSIFLDRETASLFAVLHLSDPARLEALPQQQIMQQWWRYMSDIMETKPDHSPVSIPLQEVFYLA